MLQVGQGQQQQAMRLQHSAELAERQRHFVALQMFEIVRGPDGVNRIGSDRTHIGDRADDVGLHGRVEVEPDLAPFGTVKMPVQLLPQWVTAADIQDGLGHRSAPIVQT